MRWLLGASLTVVILAEGMLVAVSPTTAALAAFVLFGLAATTQRRKEARKQAPRAPWQVPAPRPARLRSTRAA